jgi:hypothetical protein
MYVKTLLVVPNQAVARANYRKVTAADAAVSWKELGMEDSDASSGMCPKYQGPLRKTFECFKSCVHIQCAQKERAVSCGSVVH